MLAPDFDDLLVPPGDSAALAQSILRVIDWRSESPALGQRCRGHVIKKFSLPTMIGQLAGIFEDVAGAGARTNAA